MIIWVSVTTAMNMGGGLVQCWKKYHRWPICKAEFCRHEVHKVLVEAQAHLL